MNADLPDPEDDDDIAPGPTGAGGGEARRLAVPPDAAGTRLDRFLTEALGGAESRSRIQAVIAAGGVGVNGRTALTANRKVAGGDVVSFTAPEPAEPAPEPEAIPLRVLFEDAAVIVIDKPAGLVVHPGAGNWTGTLVNALLHHCGASLSGIGGVKRPGIVHRLDKDTSGVMVAAKNDQAHRSLSAQFAAHGRDGRMERAYLAAVWGVPARRAGTIDAPLGRSTSDRTKRQVVPPARADARHALTRYEVLARAPGGEASLVRCVLETGRTHQIRVHMAHLGHPLIGDDLYGAAFRTKARRLQGAAAEVVTAFGRQALHAALLAFEHPVTGERMRFEASPPADMRELIAALGLLG
ncbi:RluA family pseudouridine synthase [Aureimonas leprariae]|uniref:Pseudouridine synthase n=1 Tax=Plantimonas leprariae TaxID=2615207 RepID=A0A7V7PMA6_9HYPH|nr:RluA family pseudouridine synthase [Aureimonas leprariae]KAB0678035.1 RluA family pseudouridine synthase [Aureimonas leprariae]